MFTRQVMRQTKLSEYIGISEEEATEHPLDVIYTVHPSHLRVNKVNDLIDFVNAINKVASFLLNALISIMKSNHFIGFLTKFNDFID